MAERTPPDWEPLTATLAARALAADDPSGWFEPLYAAGRAGSVLMPWDRPGAHPVLMSRLARGDLTGAGRTAVVVGCGLGEDAEEIARRGYRTTAFDISPSAVQVARERRPDSPVDYRVADLFALPGAWRHAFDLVVEVFTELALPPARQAAAAAAVAGLVAPGGTLLVVAVIGDAPTPVPVEDGPPWPLRPQDLGGFAVDGVVPVGSDDVRVGSVVLRVAELRSAPPS